MWLNKFGKKFAPKFCNHWEDYFKYSFISSIVVNKHNNKCTLCVGILLNKIMKASQIKRYLKRKNSEHYSEYWLKQSLHVHSWIKCQFVQSFIWFLSISALYRFHIQHNSSPEYMNHLCVNKHIVNCYCFFLYIFLSMFQTKKSLMTTTFRKFPN